jgi:hypothetical protein
MSIFKFIPLLSPLLWADTAEEAQVFNLVSERLAHPVSGMMALVDPAVMYPSANI